MARLISSTVPGKRVRVELDGEAQVDDIGLAVHRLVDRGKVHAHAIHPHVRRRVDLDRDQGRTLRDPGQPLSVAGDVPRHSGAVRVVVDERPQPISLGSGDLVLERRRPGLTWLTREGQQRDRSVLAEIHAADEVRMGVVDAGVDDGNTNLGIAEVALVPGALRVDRVQVPLARVEVGVVRHCRGRNRRRCRADRAGVSGELVRHIDQKVRLDRGNARQRTKRLRGRRRNALDDRKPALLDDLQYASAASGDRARQVHRHVSGEDDDVSVPRRRCQHGCPAWHSHGHRKQSDNRYGNDQPRP